MDILKRRLYIIFICCLCTGVFAENYIVSQYSPGDFKVFHDGHVACIYVNPDAPTVCRIAAENLSADIARVCGAPAPVTHSVDQLSGSVIFIGIAGDAWMDSLKQRPNTSAIEDQWESWITEVVDAPLNGVEQGLIIIGSDRRGAAFGVFDLSEQIGVSPWIWWADVPVQKRDTIIIHKGRYQQGPPSVKYRGIFINDEDWGLKPWAAKTFDPELGDIGPKTYAKVFELLLRLKANYIWPAMHACTRAFNTYPENKQLADDYAIVMGSSHCEQMLRDNVDEWHRWQPADGSERGDWDWCNNSEQITEYWQQRVEANGKYENIYTMGMRGIHDSGMPCSGVSKREKVQKMQNELIPAQRKMLAEFVNPDASKVPQIFCPYKEVLELYELGLKLPDDITIVWPDDNHGYIRRLSNTAERARSGAGGVYYHVSYLGSPHSFVWLSSTPPALIWEEMTKAYRYGADRVWVLNVGDIKPAEIGITFFMQLGWDINRWDETNLDQFLPQWAEETFGVEYAKDIATIMTEYYQLAQARKPEHMGFGGTWPTKPNREPEFSPTHYGDESQKRIDCYLDIESKAKEILDKLPDVSKDAFYQLVYYPVRGASLMNQKYLFAQKSRLYAQQGRVYANDCAEKARAAHEAIITATDFYNNEVAGGKWKNMMSWNPRKVPVFDKPQVATVEPVSGASMGVVIEGQTGLAADDASAPANQLPAFNAAVQSKYFIDIFNKGDKLFEWEASVSAPWIQLSQPGGMITDQHQQRIWVTVDGDALQAGENQGQITIVGPQKKVVISVRAQKSDALSKNGFLQAGGTVSIEAEHFTAQTNKDKAAWTVIPDLGCSGDSVMILPVTAPSVPESNLADSPTLEYTVYLNEVGDLPVTVYCLPTHAITSEHGLRYAVSFDDAKPLIVDFDTKEWSAPWSVNVLRGAALSSTTHTLAKPGQHTLKIRMVDPGVVLDKIVIGQMPVDYLGPPESRIHQ